MEQAGLESLGNGWIRTPERIREHFLGMRSKSHPMHPSSSKPCRLRLAVFVVLSRQIKELRILYGAGIGSSAWAVLHPADRSGPRWMR